MKPTSFPYYSYLKGRNFLYLLESLPIMYTQKVIGKSFNFDLTKENIAAIRREGEKLFKSDVENVEKGYYTWREFLPESGAEHFKRFFKISVDNALVAWRKRNRKIKVFSKQAITEDAPEYYLRNFHFQTDGYFSEHSASMYEHQVEILFKGTAASMRRAILPFMKDYIGTTKPQILEMAAGTGAATAAVARMFPRGKVTALDLSSSYLQKAKERLQEFLNVNFVVSAAETTPFQNESFDFVYSVFLFHELPHEVRQQVLRESARVLHAGGYVLVMDSIQRDDIADLNWAIEEFPKDFHEPFYKNYIETPMEDLLKEAGFEVVNSKVAFLSKIILARKK